MSVLWLLLILGGVVAVLTNIWRHGNIDLTGKDANIRGVHWRAMAAGAVVCALLRVNLIDILQNSEGHTLYIGWMNAAWNANAPLMSQIGFVFDEVVGIAATAVVLAFVAKFWNDAFDVLYEFKRWLRGNANAKKPEAAVVTRTVTRRSRSSRRRGGNSEGDQRSRDNRDPRMSP